MATSGAYYNTAFNFTYAIAKASDPTVFFTSTFTAGEVKVSKRSGAGTITTANIASLPVPNSSGLMNISLTASEMQADEITIEFIPSSGDFGARAVSITTEPTPGDILEVQKSAVTGVADFKATGFSTFDASSDTVTTDAASRTASQADVSSLATASALSTVDTEVGQIKAKTDQLTFTVANQVDANALTGGGDATSANQSTIINHLTDVKGAGWVSTDNLAEITEDVTGLNGSAMRGTDGANTLTPPTAASITDAVWDEALSGHNVGGSTGKALRQMKEGTITIEASINDTSATTTSFVTNLAESTTNFYNNKIMVFISGSLSGQARIVTGYNGSTKAISLEEALTSAPANGDEFLILATHENSIGEIQAGLATSAEVAVVDANVDQILLDTGTDGVVISTAQAQALADEVLKRSVTNTQDSADAHSLAAIVLGILESSRDSTTWTIKKTTGSTFTTKTLTLDEDADPVVGVD